MTENRTVPIISIIPNLSLTWHPRISPWGLQGRLTRGPQAEFLSAINGDRIDSRKEHKLPEVPSVPINIRYLEFLRLSN